MKKLYRNLTIGFAICGAVGFILLLCMCIIYHPFLRTEVMTMMMTINGYLLLMSSSFVLVFASAVAHSLYLYADD